MFIVLIQDLVMFSIFLRQTCQYCKMVWCILVSISITIFLLSFNNYHMIVV